MKVRCERDGTTFDAIVAHYPTEKKPSTMYDKDGDKFIQCPTCGRRYFHYNNGSDLKPDDKRAGYHSDRPLTML